MYGVEFVSDTFLPVVNLEDRVHAPLMPAGNDGRNAGLSLDTGAPLQVSRCMEGKGVQHDRNVPGNDNDDHDADDVDILDTPRRSCRLHAREHDAM